MYYEREFLDEAAQTIIKAESYMNDESLMKAVEPIIEEIKKSAERLKGFDFKSMKELAGRKELEEKGDGYASAKDTPPLGEDEQVYKIPSKA